jgi:hypothetical protein
MMGFIYDEGDGPALEQGCFHRFSQLAFSDSGDFAIYKRVLKSA